MCIKNNFKDYIILRLPIVYGKNFKKNIIYDALHNHELHKINTEAQIQIYNVKNLMKDINFALKNKINILNVATEPIVVKELYKKVFNINRDNGPGNNFKYDMKTKYSALRGKGRDYIYNLNEIINELKEFKREYES